MRESRGGRALAVVLLTTVAIAGCYSAATEQHPATGQSSAAQAQPSEQEIAALFDGWNAALSTVDPLHLEPVPA